MKNLNEDLQVFPDSEKLFIKMVVAIASSSNEMPISKVIDKAERMTGAVISKILETR